MDSTVTDNTQQLAGLDQDAYHNIVGPALKAAADVAADRGDPTLAADMPCMLALIDMVSGLTNDYDAHAGTTHADDIRQITAAACVMVMQEAGLEEAAIGQCLAALETAYKQLLRQAVTQDAGELVDNGGEFLRSGDREAGQAYLKQATQRIVAAIETWRERVH